MIKVVQNLKYQDERGELIPFFRKKEWDVEFVEDRLSISTYGTVRGFHGDSLTYKLCTCVYGSLYLVYYDLKNKRHGSIILDDETNLSILIPPNFLNGHQCLSQKCILLYKWSQYYNGPENQWSIYYNDDIINPKWPTTITQVSDRDKQAPKLKDTYLWT